MFELGGGGQQFGFSQVRVLILVVFSFVYLDFGFFFFVRWFQVGYFEISQLERGGLGFGGRLFLQQVRLILRVNLVMFGRGFGKYWKFYLVWEFVGVFWYGRVIFFRVFWIFVYLRCLFFFQDFSLCFVYQRLILSLDVFICFRLFWRAGY